MNIEKNENKVSENKNKFHQKIINSFIRICKFYLKVCELWPVRRNCHQEKNFFKKKKTMKRMIYIYEYTNIELKNLLFFSHNKS